MLLAAATHDPYLIFERARQVWTSQQYPRAVAYTIAVTVDDRGVTKKNHYRAVYDTLLGRIYVDAVSEEERDHPYVPNGIDMSIAPKRQFRTLFKRPVGRPQRAVDYLGVPVLAPTYSFGISPLAPLVASQQPDQTALVEEIRRQFHDPMSKLNARELGRADDADLRTIARVIVAKKDYTIVYRGVASLDGRTAFHLSLRPLRPSYRLRLRELWIDTQNYRTLQLVTQGNFDDQSVPWLVTFDTIGGAQYLETEAALKPFSHGRYTYRQAAISFEGITPLSSLPHDMWLPVTPTADLLTEPPGSSPSQEGLRQPP